MTQVSGFKITDVLKILMGKQVISRNRSSGDCEQAENNVSAERHKDRCLRARGLAGCTERWVGLKMAL